VEDDGAADVVEHDGWLAHTCPMRRKVMTYAR